MRSLIKSVMAALPIYIMSCFQLPIQLAKEIEQIIARFWWRDQRIKKRCSLDDLEQSRKKEGGWGSRL